MRQIEIPSFLNHLKVDERGYPVPFFVAWVSSKPDFRMMDANKQRLASEKKLCGICGKKLYEYFYFIAGTVGLANATHSDPPMHRDCAEYSLRTCPHLLFANAKRNERGEYYKQAASENYTGIVDKSPELFLIKADKYKLLTEHHIFSFRKVSWEKYLYVDGILQKEKL